MLGGMICSQHVHERVMMPSPTQFTTDLASRRRVNHAVLLSFLMLYPFLLLPTSYVNPNIFTHRPADRELIRPSYPPHRALHACPPHLPHNRHRRRDRAVELRSRATPIY